MVNLQSILKRNDANFLASELGNETVIMDINTGDYLGLNEVSTDIWKMLQQPLAANDVVDNLLALYNVSRGECEKQTLAFLNQMLEQHMISISV
ncbi:PqqD family peptide modification chaperone [Mucilaginibacter paludis]|uniref:Coenzyme PQQ synthesis protein D (PqqD) n=1 Tax=Mucilaginibacter paludis DSM 18603 TaxID=714943 RepID=H1Y2A9_9SPHI|nr:PqqD family peptide modification chaperone [Mucilaginibacter paludis]EHQ27889.1 hypothetical protein Mucpa_3791 [Mucilaginibacter paludis DSM 18603]